MPYLNYFVINQITVEQILSKVFDSAIELATVSIKKSDG